MTSDEFVRRIQRAVYESSISGSLSLLEKPPGRRPSQRLVELSRWFGHLGPEDKEYLRATIEMAVHGAVFQMLTVLDGVTSVHETGEERGRFELWYKSGTNAVLLNSPADENLHDLFVQYVPAE